MSMTSKWLYSGSSSFILETQQLQQNNANVAARWRSPFTLVPNLPKRALVVALTATYCFVSSTVQQTDDA